MATTRDHVDAASLAFVAGYVDTLCFVALFGLFTAHVTGNFVLIGSEMVNPSQGMLLKWLAFPAFVAGVVAARVSFGGGATSRRLITLQALLLLLGLTSGVMSDLSVAQRGSWHAAAAALVAAAMGVQNAAGRLVWGSLAPTTVMTGNVTQAVLDLVDVIRGSTPEVPGRLAQLAWPVAAFAAGAMAGAWAYHFVHFWGLALPLLILAALAWRQGR